MRQPRLVLDVRVPDAPLPADLTMRGARYAPSFQAGARRYPCECEQPQQRSGPVALVVDSVGRSCADAQPARQPVRTWPGGRHLDRRARISRCGPLADAAAADRLAVPARRALRHGVAEEANSTTFAPGLTAQGRDTAVVDEAEAALSAAEHVVTPAGEGRPWSFQQFRKVLSSETAAARWVTWAERHHLLVRGVNIVCPNCGASSWLPWRRCRRRWAAPAVAVCYLSRTGRGT